MCCSTVAQLRSTLSTQHILLPYTPHPLIYTYSIHPPPPRVVAVYVAPSKGPLRMTSQSDDFWSSPVEWGGLGCGVRPEAERGMPQTIHVASGKNICRRHPAGHLEVCGPGGGVGKHSTAQKARAAVARDAPEKACMRSSPSRATDSCFLISTPFVIPAFSRNSSLISLIIPTRFLLGNTAAALRMWR